MSAERQYRSSQNPADYESSMRPSFEKVPAPTPVEKKVEKVQPNTMELNQAVTFSEDLSEREQSNEIENPDLAWLEKVSQAMDAINSTYDKLEPHQKTEVVERMTKLAKTIGDTSPQYAKIYNKFFGEPKEQ